MNYKYKWDEAKRVSNHQKHGINFLDAVGIFKKRIISARLASRKERKWYEEGR